MSVNILQKLVYSLYSKPNLYISFVWHVVCSYWQGYPSKAGQQGSADLSCMSKAPAWPPSPLNCTRKEAGAAMAVTTPICSPSRSSKGPCSMCSSTKAETLPGATFVLSRMSCRSHAFFNAELALILYAGFVCELHTS